MHTFETDGEKEQDGWEDFLDKDSKPKLKFPVDFSASEIMSVNLEFPTIEVKDPAKPKPKNTVTNVKFTKKKKGGLF